MMSLVSRATFQHFSLFINVIVVWFVLHRRNIYFFNDWSTHSRVQLSGVRQSYPLR